MENEKKIKNCNEIDLNAHAVIEASAGTGKTYTITGLVIRFILGLRNPSGAENTASCQLNPLTVDRILLSTFTRAATEEMKRKVRDALIGACGDFQNVELIISCSDLCGNSWGSVKNSFSGTFDKFKIEHFIRELVFELIDLRLTMNHAGADISELIIGNQDIAEIKGIIHQSRLRLENAVTDIDRASVVTMHQFCQSMLRKNAFESGVLFRTKLISKVEDNRQRAVEFKKRYFLYGKGDRSISDYLLYKSLTDLDDNFFTKTAQIEHLDELLNSGERKFFLSDDDFSSMIEKLQELYLQLKEYFPFTEDIIDLNIVRGLCCFTDEAVKIKGFVKSKNEYKTGCVPSNDSCVIRSAVYKTINGYTIDRSRSVKKYFEEKFGSSDFLKKWFSEFINVFALNSPVGPDKIFNPDFNDLFPYDDVTAFFDYVIWWQIRYAVSVLGATDDVLKIRQEITFDDLIKDLAAAVSESAGPTAEKLLDNIRREYPVAIIDEFQDTSSPQYRIFKRVYLDDPLKQAKLFIVGDPKQAIYAFRQADVYTYLEARDQISGQSSGKAGGKKYNLATNYRSDTDVVNFVNALFSVKDDGRTLFDYRDSATEKSIRFVDSAFPDSKDREHPDVLYVHRIKKSAWESGTVDADHGDAEIFPGLIYSSGEEHYTEEFAARNVYYLLTECCRAELLKNESDSSGVILAYKNRKYSLDSVKPSEIAVLVRTKTDAGKVSGYLAGYGIKSVYLSDRNSVKSRKPETQFMEFFLRAVVFPSEQDGIKALITCPLMQKSMEEMDRYFRASSEFSEFILLLRECHDIWNSQSFMAAFYRFIFAPFIMLPSRLKFRSDGARLLTNIMHLAEIIQRKATELPSKYAVFNWFSRLKTGDTDDSTPDSEDEEKIRAESQKDVVRIVTIFSSKGLEYPVVINSFLSYSKDSSRSKNTSSIPLFSYHKENDGDVQNVFRVITDDFNGERVPPESEGEKKDEFIRLLYVALTRARHINWIDTRNNGKGTAGSNSGHGYLWELLNRRYGDVFNKVKIKVRGKEEEKDVLYETVDYWNMFLEEMKSQEDTCQENHRFECIELNPGSKESGSSGDTEEYARFSVYEETSLSPDKLCAAEFNGRIDRSWRITSYSSLCGHSSAAAARFTPVLAKDDEPATSDEMPEDAQIRNYQIDRFHFPHGSASGTFLHHILEVIPFFDGEPDYPAKLRERMQKEVSFSYFANSATLKKWKEQEGIECLSSWFELITQTPLNFGGVKFRLCDISPAKKLPEVSFTFSLGKLHLKYLNDYLKELAEQKKWPDIGEIGDIGEITGYLSGVIDLFFEYGGKYYVVDYKSNFISGNSIDYNEGNMAGKVIENRYDMQYVIYTLAAWRFLKSRVSNFDFEKQFGGVMYLFIRGIDENCRTYGTGKPGGSYSATGGFYRNLAELGNGFIEQVDRIFSYSGKEEQE